ncbi:MAG: GyrI-like domain-containing protein [Eubacterium sp.]|nr:GyrI-like domain-containing protein [Eubacterium sp.]
MLLFILLQKIKKTRTDLICVVASSKEDEALDTYVVPAATWAVFPGEGTNRSVQDLERRIVMEWLPTSGYEYADAPDIEVYLNADPQNAKYEMWIPVRKAGNRQDITISL